MSETARCLSLAARAALRAAGDVEPNPMVGAAVVRDGQVIGLGHHRRFGGLHAEREALADCRRRGADPRGATVYVTLEPCSHHGKQPPCTDALIDAGVARVVYARPDPSPASGGGAAALRRAGIACERTTESVLATRLSDPFVKRITAGLPWVIAKWAQSSDGRMTVPPGDSPWISNPLSLKRVHRLRARVDAIVTGIGTVLSDDPLLTARGVRRVRRVARRVVIDPRGRFPQDSMLAGSVAAGPVLVIGAAGDESEAPPPGLADSADPLRVAEGDRGVEFASVPRAGERLHVDAVLRLLATRYRATNVLLECGPRLLAAFFAAALVDEAFAYIAPPERSRAWPHAPANAPGADALRAFDLVREKPLAGDLERWYRRRPDPA